jgi:hypothetical protein
MSTQARERQRQRDRDRRERQESKREREQSKREREREREREQTERQTSERWIKKHIWPYGSSPWAFDVVASVLIRTRRSRESDAAEAGEEEPQAAMAGLEDVV